MTRIVAALGGNALLRRHEGPDATAQQAHLETAVDVISALAHHDLVVTHGNGPQVGHLALRADASGQAQPLDVLGAESEGMLGYLLEREIRSRLPGRPVVTLLTQVEVDPDDPAFGRPTKPIGPVYREADAERLARERSWTVAPDGHGWRRVVPSPRPLRILELDAMRLLLDAGHLVVCGGGGGIPVAVGAGGTLRGIEAVIDKDRSAALLAAGIGADVLLLLTDVDAIYADWPERRKPIRRLAPGEIGRDGGFAVGSMGPKVEAAADFVERTGGVAVIGALEDAMAMLVGGAGTRVER